jgi:hypothetical protein
VLFFYRAVGENPERVLHLRGLNPSGNYTLTDRDRGALGTRTGADIMTNGVQLSLAELSAGILHLHQQNS